MCGKSPVPDKLNTKDFMLRSETYADTVFDGPVGDQLRIALLETYYKNCDPGPTEAELRDHIQGRFDVCRDWFIPWLQRYIDLKEAKILEIGCGTGSTTAALALGAQSVTAYDIDEKSIAAATRRIEILQIENARLRACPFNEMLEEIRSLQAIDCVVMFAVLEHQKYAERVTTLRECWNILKPGGVLVVADTPNRLTWTDYHTSLLPFFNALPDEVALDYAERSPRQDFRDAISASRRKSEDQALETLSCLGRGVSYHEFEIALGRIDGLIVGDGFDPEPLRYFGVSLETRLLYTYMKRKHLRISPAFLRDTIEVVLRKPGPNLLKARKRSIPETDTIVRPLTDA